MPRQLRIYVAGPYTASNPADMEKNAKCAIDAGIALLKKGHIPFIPHLTHYVDLRARELDMEITWEEFMRWDAEWLRQCDALLFLASSRGADIELRMAQSLGIQIFYDLNDIPDIAEAIRSKQVFAAQR